MIGYTAMLHSPWGSWGAGRAGQPSAHMLIVAVPRRPRLGICEACCDSLPPGWNGGHISLASLSPPATPDSLSCVSAGVITQQGHISVVCEHTHTCTNKQVWEELYLWSSSSERRVNGCKKRNCSAAKLILIQLFLSSVIKGWEPKAFTLCYFNFYSIIVSSGEKKSILRCIMIWMWTIPNNVQWLIIEILKNVK